MGEAIAVVVVVGILVGVTSLLQRSARSNVLAEEEGRLRHLRSGEFPTTCNWCRNTVLARQTFVYYRTESGWHARDVARELLVAPNADVDRLVQATFHAPASATRRVCSERCAREFLASEQVAAVEQFTTCDHCSARFPSVVVRCPNCGAVKTSPLAH